MNIELRIENEELLGVIAVSSFSILNYIFSILFHEKNKASHI